MPSTMKDPLYFIALLPPPQVRRDIEIIKKEIRKKYGIKHALKLPAHITLKIPYRMSRHQEALVTKKLERFSNNMDPFQTRLDGFDKFSKQVIFVKVVEHEPYIALSHQLQELILGIIDLQPHEIASKIHPHLTIATRDLNRTQFPMVWADFKNREFKAEFEANNLCLFKHNGKNWKVIKKFSLQE